MAENKGIAASIIDDTEEEEDGEEDISLEEEFQGIHLSVEDMKQRFRDTAGKLRQHNAKTPASREDLAKLYDFLVSDVLEALQDTITATGAGLVEIAGDEDEEEEVEEGPAEIEDDTLQVYTTLLTNAEAFRRLSEDTNIPEGTRKDCEVLVKLNEDSIGLFESQFDAEELREKAKALMGKVASGES